MSSPLETVRFDVADHVATVALDRPEARNAINTRMIRELEQVLSRLADDRDVRVLALVGSEDCFCAGADVKEMRGTRGGDREPPERRYRFFRDLAALPFPTVAGIGGPAVGGGLELALCCDLRIAATNAKLGLPEVKLGIMPAAGGTQRLPRLVGAALAKELILTGEIVDGSTASSLGLVTRAVRPSTVLEETSALARRLAAGPPVALRAIKRAVEEGGQLPLERGLTLEQSLAAELRDTEDHREGVRAFVEKRSPVFAGR